MSDLLAYTGMYAKERRARPCEVTSARLNVEKVHYTDILRVLDNEVIRANLDPKGEFGEKIEARLQVLNTGLEKLTTALAAERRTYCVAEREKDKWASPSSPEGWLCHEAPTGVCSYDQGDGDSCDHCEFPQERK